MEKKFNLWNNIKKYVHAEEVRPSFNEGEIWFAQLGSNVGFEQDGVGKGFVRPILVLKKFNKEVLLAIPLTRTQKKHPYYYHFPFREDISVAILSQLRLIDAKRLLDRSGRIKGKFLGEIKERIKQIIT